MSADVLDRAFDALANSHRRAIVERLAEGPVSTPELGQHFGFSKQALSRHLGVLEQAQLVSKRRHGRTDVLHANLDSLSSVNDWLARRHAAWERSLDRLGEALAAHPDDQ